jgi:DNA repair protein RecN (Recombination protein N)
VEGAGQAHEALYAGEGSVSDTLAEIRGMLERLARVDASLEPATELLGDAYHAVSEVGRRMADYAGSVDHDPARLEEIRHRLDRIVRLKRKYGPELADVLETGERVRTELEELEAADHDLERLRARLEEARGALRAAAEALSEARTAAAERLAGAVEGVLPELGMPGAVFQVRLDPLPEVGAGGGEMVTFRVAPNPGFEPMALAGVASGGELSRVMLALKSILATVDRVPVLVFDEIDAGIGGVVATAVARKLQEVAGRHQVFVVTHLPQLASRAGAHLLVEKGRADGRASTGVRSLEGEGRVEEIARMLGGDPDSSTSREHARELLGAG